MITINGKEFRNLVEQVQKNKDDIQKHYDIDQTLTDWGIKVIGRLDEWVVPEGVFEYGDAYAVGPEGGPFDFYIWTRSIVEGEGYWLNYGAISIVGPQGPEGPQGPQGEPGTASQWFARPSAPSATNATQNDMFINTSTGDIYQFINQRWVKMGNIKGPQGPQGPAGAEGPIGPAGATGERGPRGYTTITRIIGELPEGSIISDTYDPALQPENATVLMPVNGETHAWVIIDGMWTDAGPYSGGSAVYVNGEFEQTFDADTKLDKMSESGARIYSSLNGVPGSIVYTDSTVANTIPIRRNNNNFKVGTPTQDDECATKKYADELFTDSETITIATDEDGKKTMNLDAEIVSNLSRAILIPMSAPTGVVVPTLDSMYNLNYRKYTSNSYKSFTQGQNMSTYVSNYAVCEVWAVNPAAYTGTGVNATVFGTTIGNVIGMTIRRFSTKYIITFYRLTTGGAQAPATLMYDSATETDTTISMNTTAIMYITNHS